MPKISWSGWGRRKFVLLFLVQLFVIWSMISLIQNSQTDQSSANSHKAGKHDRTAGRHARSSSEDGTRDLEGQEASHTTQPLKHHNVFTLIPFFNELSRNLEVRNHELPRNRDLFPTLAEDHITIVLYVHNRPQYLQLVVKSLSKVGGINETLLVVSHDGFFPEMNAIIDGIRFCQVKQIFAPFSPHLFPNSFPGQGPNDCRDSQNAEEKGCKGNPDQYGNHRAPRIVSLKHHWWWMMNTVWDGLEETRTRDGHVLFIEEDHFLLPNAYRTIQQLSRMVGTKCPECVAVNLAPVEVLSRGEGFQNLVVEKIGNVGYAFNRTVWNWMLARADPFCLFDEYNWDITMWAVVYPSFPTAGYTLRGPTTSAIHFGKCGLHQGQDKSKGLVCVDEKIDQFMDEFEDDAPFLDENWRVVKYGIQGYTKGFQGWGGWGDTRDQELCVNFSKMYDRASAS